MVASALTCDIKLGSCLEEVNQNSIQKRWGLKNGRERETLYHVHVHNTRKAASGISRE